MKAIGYDKYTEAGGRQFVDVDVPKPSANEVLVRALMLPLSTHSTGTCTVATRA